MIPSPFHHQPVCCHARFIRVFSLGICLLLPSTLWAAELTTNVYGRINVASIRVVDERVNGLPLNPSGDSVSRQGMTNSNQGPTPTLRFESTTGITGNALGAGGSWAGKSLIIDNGMGGTSSPITAAVSGGKVTLQDEITVTSPTLPDGTPVDVEFSFYAVHSSMLTHTHVFVPNNNTSTASFDFNASISSPTGTISIPRADNLFFAGPNSTPLVSLGMMDPATPQRDVTFSSLVGETISLHMEVDAEIAGGVVAMDRLDDNVLGLVDNEGTGIGALGVAFGATPVSPDTNLGSQLVAAATALPDVVLESELFGGAFPLASMATPANAAAAMPDIVIPTPSTASIILAACLVVGFRARRGQAGQSSACPSREPITDQACV